MKFDVMREERELETVISESGHVDVYIQKTLVVFVKRTWVDVGQLFALSKIVDKQGKVVKGACTN